MKSLWVSRTLVSNAQVAHLVNLINRCGLENHRGGAYLFLNDVNTNNPIRYDRSSGEYKVRPGWEDRPARGVTWYRAVIFSAMLGGRLPTELEWEVCATSGHPDYTYPWGNDEPSPPRANYGNIVGEVTRVTAFPPNEWGLHDVAGNLRQWCLDPYHPAYPFPLNRRITAVESEYRVVKGGAWDKPSLHLKCSGRAGKWLRIGTTGIGFRVVRGDD